MALQSKFFSALFFIIILVSAESKAQTQTPTETKDYLPMSEVDEKPTFPGGINEFYKFIQANYQTPKVQGLEGKLYMTFVIEKDGSVTGVKTLRDIGYGTGDEAVRVLQNSPKWIPGKLKGENVRVLYALPITITASEKSLGKVYSIAEVFEKPTYPGGLQNFYIDISKHFKSPEKVGLKGKIVIGFVIEKDGSIIEAAILKDLGYGTGEEALRTIKLVKKWNPGKLKDGAAVRTAYSLPLTIQ